MVFQQNDHGNVGQYTNGNDYKSTYATVGRLGYSNWNQTSGYFDGDGAVIPLIQYYNLIFHLTWSDTYSPQLEQLKTFLESEGLHPAKITDGATAYFLPLYRQDEVLMAAKKMLPFAYKKWYDLSTLAAYLENRITGSEAMTRLNESIKARSRSAPIRYVHMPFLRSEGAYAGRVLGARRAAESRKLLTRDQVQKVIKCREAGMPVKELTSLFNVSKDTIYKVINGEYK
jgi:hypothetical protein